ncbi:MAG: LysR substrate-binding domain-containing protein [Steroidobacteraceae bacterium]
MGLIQVLHFDVQHLLDRGELVEVMPEFRAASMPVSLIYPHRRQRSRRLNAFIEWLAALMRPHLRTVMALTLRPEQRPTGTASALASEVPPIGPLGGIWRCL